MYAQKPLSLFHRFELTHSPLSTKVGKCSEFGEPEPLPILQLRRFGGGKIR